MHSTREARRKWRLFRSEFVLFCLLVIGILPFAGDLKLDTKLRPNEQLVLAAVAVAALMGVVLVRMFYVYCGLRLRLLFSPSHWHDLWQSWIRLRDTRRQSHSTAVMPVEACYMDVPHGAPFE